MIPPRGDVDVEAALSDLTAARPASKHLGLRLKHWTAIGGVIVGLLVATPFLWLASRSAATSNQVASNCQQIEQLKAAIRQSIERIVVTSTPAGSVAERGARLSIQAFKERSCSLR